MLLDTTLRSLFIFGNCGKCCKSVNTTCSWQYLYLINSNCEGLTISSAFQKFTVSAKSYIHLVTAVPSVYYCFIYSSESCSEEAAAQSLNLGKREQNIGLVFNIDRL